MAWQYQGVDFIDPSEFFGFIYRITNKQTGRMYIGRKLFTKAKVKAVTKTRKRKQKSRVANDWQNYWGSSAELLADIASLGEDEFTREILHLTTKRGETNYFEALEILTSGALLSDKYYNKWVSLKLHKSSLAHLSSSSHSSPIIKSAPLS
jgi:Putative endonuclease segE, GIY-YIG domain